MEILGSTPLDQVFDRCIDLWHNDPGIAVPADVAANELALRLAHRNFLLWHEEDKARRKDVDDSAIAAVKRSIDVPSLEIDRSSSTPSTVATASSRRWVISDSISSGAAPR